MRAGAGVGSVLPRREEVRAQVGVQAFQNLRHAQFARCVHRGAEVAPEVGQHRLPGQLAVGDFVELLFQVGGEGVLDVAAEISYNFV